MFDIFKKYTQDELDIQLAMAIENKEYIRTKVLINKGANIHKAYMGFTPLFAAIHTKSLMMVKLLVNHGADIHKPDSDKRTAIIFSSVAGTEKISEYLLGLGANIEDKDYDGETPLIHAARSNDSWIIKVLLEHGADMEVTGQRNRTAKDISMSLNNAAAIALYDGYEQKRKDAIIIPAKKLLNSIPAGKIASPENADILQKVTEAGLLVECFVGLNYERQNALLIATAKDVMADAELAKQIQTIMQKTLTKERAGTANVTQLGIYRDINQLVNG